LLYEPPSATKANGEAEPEILRRKAYLDLAETPRVPRMISRWLCAGSQISHRTTND
jgi:hypothetical protein